MPNDRRPYSPAEELALTTQVEGACPLCGKTLFYVKRSRSYKEFDIAHIYPLNPTPEEVRELASVRRLHHDVNHPDNLIPLCKGCHSRFDKPRTVEEYDKLAAIKQRLIDRNAQQALNTAFPIEDDIRRIIDGLYHVDTWELEAVDVSYDPKRLNAKFDTSLPLPVRHKIRHAVADYYHHVRGAFRELERETPAASSLIFAQVRAYYLKQKSLGLSQGAIYRNIVEWIDVKTKTQTAEAAEIVASFFIQNCEVFE